MGELRIGVQSSDRALGALRRCGALEELLKEHGARAVWIEYDDAVRTIDLLASGDLHVAGTGVMPPLRAQSEGVDIVYVAVSAPIRVAGALVVRSGSSVADLSGLLGRRVVIERGSAPTQLLATVLDRAGVVAYRDIELELLPVALGRRALLDGHADAWLDHTQAQPQRGAALRELPDGAAEVEDRTVWFARRDIAVERRELVDALVVALRRPPCAVQPITRAFVTSQQRTADLFAGQGVIELPVNVAAATTVEVA